jgi:hypothetical protein
MKLLEKNAIGNERGRKMKLNRKYRVKQIRKDIGEVRKGTRYKGR